MEFLESCELLKLDSIESAEFIFLDSVFLESALKDSVILESLLFILLDSVISLESKL